MPICGKIMPSLMPPEPAGPRVVVLAYDGLCTFEFGVAYEVFGLPRPEMGPAWYRYAVAGIEPGPLRAAGGLRLGRGSIPASADLIVVPGWKAIDAPVRALVEALTAAQRRGAGLVPVFGRCRQPPAAFSTVAVPRPVALYRRDRGRTRHPPGRQSLCGRATCSPRPAAPPASICACMSTSSSVPRPPTSPAGWSCAAPRRRAGAVHPTPDAGRAGNARLGPLIDWLRRHPGKARTIRPWRPGAGASPRTFNRLKPRPACRRAMAGGGTCAHGAEMLEAVPKPRSTILPWPAASARQTMRHHFRRASSARPPTGRASPARGS